MQQLLAASG